MSQTPTGSPALRLLLVGATGVVGQAVLARALADPRIREVVALTRRPLPAQNKLVNIVVDFDALPPTAAWWQADVVVCTLGTTMKSAGSRARFAAVDRDLPVLVAKRARDNGATSFALNSSLGANPTSANFYLRTKGEAEEAIGRLGYPVLTLVRPSLIDAQRSESRPGERAAILVGRLLRPLTPARYRPVTPGAIAQALLEGAVRGAGGVRIVESEALTQSAPSVPGAR